MGGDGQAQGEYGHFVGRGDASGCVAKVIVEGVLRVHVGMSSLRVSPAGMSHEMVTSRECSIRDCMS